MPSTKADKVSPTYRIGAVSRLTGIPAETLRVWERRYNVVKPGRAEGRFRLYTRDDIERLALIKQLIDVGNAIGSIANLSLVQLQERIQTYSTHGLKNLSKENQTCRVIILGDVLSARISQHSQELCELDIIATYQDRQQFESNVEDKNPDVIVLEYLTVDENTVADIDQLLQCSNAKYAVIVYNFARYEVIQRLDTTKTIPIRAPLSASGLKRVCLGTMHTVPLSKLNQPVRLDPVPTRAYDNDSLSNILTSPTIFECECPHHLADLVLNLSAFETYSAECENKSKEDAALHAYLHAVTAQARSLMEQALSRVVEAEALLR